MQTSKDPQEAADLSESSVRSMNSVLTTLQIYEEVATRQPIGVSSLARETGIPKSSVQRCLVTLQKAGWLRVVDQERVRWGVTAKALVLGLRGAGEQDLNEIATPAIRRLAAQTKETVFLALRDGDDCVMIARIDSTHAVRVYLEIGTRIPLQATSAGVAILSRLSVRDVEAVIGHRVDSVGGGSVPSPDELRKEIEATGRRGYSLNMSSWYRPHVATIGAPIVSADGVPIAGIALSIPEMRYDHSKEDELAQLVVKTAAEISELLAQR